MTKYLILGIDASNLLDGGGLTHIIEFLKKASPKKFDFKKVIIWGSKSTLSMITDKNWLIKRCVSTKIQILIFRIIWQKFFLSFLAKKMGCDILFIPGGLYFGNFKPFVTMSRNMLPFEKKELFRFGFSFTTLRLLLLRCFQSRTFCRANGLIFLTSYASNKIQLLLGKLRGLNSIIPHGLDKRFQKSKKIFYKIGTYTHKQPFKLLYVSPIEVYKHQWNVIEAVNYLRKKKNWPLTLDLVGSSNNKSSLNYLDQIINKYDKDNNWIKCYNKVSYFQIHTFYTKADLGIFASSCENLPNILIEMMGASLPIACSRIDPMPEILKDSSIFFDPLKPHSIAKSIEYLIKDIRLRKRCSQKSFELSKNFNWYSCANETFNFLRKVYFKSEVQKN